MPDEGKIICGIVVHPDSWANPFCFVESRDVIWCVRCEQMMQGVMITCEAPPRVLSTLLEGSLPFWHWLHLGNLKVTCLLVVQMFLHWILVKPQHPTWFLMIWLFVCYPLPKLARDGSNSGTGCSWEILYLCSGRFEYIRMWRWSYVVCFYPLEGSSRFWH